MKGMDKDMDNVFTLEEGKKYIVGKNVRAGHYDNVDIIYTDDVIRVVDVSGIVVSVILGELSDKVLHFNKIVLEKYAGLMLKEDME